MSIESVGLGKLPNVYFEKITLEDLDTKSFRIVSHLIIFDQLDENSFIWSNDSLFSSFMKIALIETSDLGMINELTNGENIHPSKLKKSRNWNDNSSIITFGFSEFRKSEDRDDKHFRIKAPIIKSLESTDSVLFTYAYIDHEQLSNYLHIKLTGLLSQYMGPVASEIVMANGAITKTSNLFKKPDMSAWSGPVHKLSQDWYSGSEPNTDSVKLSIETVRNSKLIDLRSAYLSNRSYLKTSDLSMISDVEYSLNSNADLFGVFSIDLKNIALLKTKFGKSIYGLSDEFFSNVVDSIVVNSIEVFRRQVKFRKQSNRLGTSMYSMEDVLPRELVGTLANIDQIKATNNRFINTYSFSDTGKNEGDRGEFIYEVKLTFVDKTQELVENLLLETKTNLNGLKDIVSRLNSQRNYNNSLDQLKNSTIIPPTIMSYIDHYFKIVSIMKDVEPETIGQMIVTKKSSFNKSNYKKEYGLNFISEYEKLYDSMNRRFGLTPKDIKQNKANPSYGYPPNIIQVSKVFKQQIKFSSVESSYDIIGKESSNGILTLNKEEFESRANLEVTRFFDLSKATSSEDMFKIDDDDSKALRDVEASKMLFMSPLSFKFKDQKIKTDRLEDVDIDKLSEKFIESKISSSERNISSRSKAKVDKKQVKVTSSRKLNKKSSKNNKFKFNFRPVALKINQISKSKNDYRESSEYLGDGSEFVNIEVNTDRSIDAKDTKQSLLRFSIANELKAKRNKKSFDITEKGNFYEKLKSSPHYDLERLKKLPISLKSLFNSRSTAAKNNIHDSESDLLKEVDTKIASEMIFHSSQKIQALNGYEMTEHGESILSRPIWVDLTEDILSNGQDILCKMSYVEDALLGMIPSQEFKMTVLNSTFVIKGNGINNDNVDIILEDDNQLPEPSSIIYATSNIVKQPRS